VTVRCQVSPRVSFLIILLTSLAGCLQEAPAPSTEQTSALLTSLLRDESPEIRRTAAESLGKIGDPAAALFILPLVTDPAPAVRVAAAQALGRFSSGSIQGVLDALTRALEDSDDSVKQAASMAIGEIEPASDQLGSVVSLVNARDLGVRRAAIRVLLQVDAGRWLSALVPAVHDSDSEVRQGVVAVLGESGESAVVPVIRKRLIEDSSPAVRAEAAYQLGKLGGFEARAALELASGEDSEPGVRRWAEAQLRSLRVPD
jgi:HEAT repeat protein